jgi:hypothetical protein
LIQPERLPSAIQQSELRSVSAAVPLPFLVCRCSIAVAQPFDVLLGTSGRQSRHSGERLRSMLIMLRIDFPHSLCSEGLAPKKFSCAKLIQVDNLTRQVSTSLMRTGIVSVHITHAMGRSRAEVESDTSALLESITRARNHLEIA